MSIAIEQSDERFYLVGPTFSLKEKIKSLGCKFDTARRQWYASEKSVADKVLTLFSSDSGNQSVKPAKPSISTTDKIIKGRALYNGREYYVLVDANKNDKRMIKLVFRDGSKVFWARDAAEVDVLATYKKPKSIDSLNSFKSCIAAAKTILEADEQNKVVQNSVV